MAKKTSYLPWIIGGVAAWFVFLKPKSIQGISGFSKKLKETIGLPSTNPLTWKAKYKIGDLVRLRIDTAKNENLNYNSLQNSFTIIKIEDYHTYLKDPLNKKGVLYVADNGLRFAGYELEPVLGKTINGEIESIPKVDDYVDGFGKYTKPIIEIDEVGQYFKLHDDYGGSQWHKFSKLKIVRYSKNGRSEWTRNYKG